MTDSLRDRIAAILNEAYPQGRYSRYHDAVARDLIRELGLHQEIFTESLTDLRTGSAPTERTMHRYVTEWVHSS